MYFKGTLFINTLRSVVNDDRRWWKLLHDFYQRFKYQNIMTEDVVQFFNQQTGMNLTPSSISIFATRRFLRWS
jgi:aminopeptidase N